MHRLLCKHRIVQQSQLTTEDVAILEEVDVQRGTIYGQECFSSLWVVKSCHGKTLASFGPYNIPEAMDRSHERNGMQGVNQGHLIQPNLNLIDTDPKLFVVEAALKGEF